MALTPRAAVTFALVADTLLPRVEGDTPALTASATELGLPTRLAGLYELLPDERARSDLSRLLRLLDSPAGGAALYGRTKRFRDLDPTARIAALRAMSTSRLVQVRQAFKALKLLAGLLYTTAPAGEVRWVVWEAMGYPGPDGPAPSVPKPLTPMTPTADATWDADVVVVGSGAGGGPAAAVLAGAGLDVVVVEKGGYRNEADFTHVEFDAYRHMYLDAGLSGTADSGIAMLAGSTLGGGTVINYSTSFPTPPAVREQWDAEAGFDDVFTGRDYEAASQAVLARLGINLDHNQPSQREVLMEKALRDLGWHVQAMPRNVAGCDPADCGYCGFGCRRGAKQSSLRTWLEDAAAAGARFVTGADVERVLTDGGRATGIEARVDGHRLVVRARAVVLAAGALNTPAILLRSGLGSRAVGRHLRLHPVTAVWGRFAESVRPWTGVMQALYSDEFADLDGDGYGFKFETAAVHPLFPALFFGWSDGAQWKRDLLAIEHWSPLGVLLRDRGAGRIKVRRDGRPAWHYRLGKTDTAHMRQGVRRAAQALAAAGAEEVMASTSPPVRWQPGRSGSLEGFVLDADQVGYGPNQTSYLSFHQMGSARMGSSPRTSVVGPDNQVHGTRGLYVMDGSCFPTASGVNPMVSIQAIAHRGASALAAALA